MLSDHVLAAVNGGALPIYVYDLAAVRERAASAVSLLDRCYFPIKACPIEAVVRTAIAAGCGLDLCSAGDLTIAAACAPSSWSFTSAHTPGALLRELAAAGAVFDADSVEQLRQWRAAGGEKCGLRIASADRDSPYGAKFGMAASEVAGLDVAGLHVHEAGASRSPAEMAARIVSIVKRVGRSMLRRCEYVNIGGGWPMRNGWPVDAGEMRGALVAIRAALAEEGFAGMLTGEPGEWIVGPSGYWAAAVSAVKRHPYEHDRSVIVLDTATPVPCRPSAAPFVLLRGGRVVHNGSGTTRSDVYGSANTGLDVIGSGILLPDARPGDVVVSLGQGAYTRSLTGSFNERPLPGFVAI